MKRVLGMAGVVCVAALSTAAFAQQSGVQPLAPKPADQKFVSDPVVIKQGEVVAPQGTSQVATTGPADAAPPNYVSTSQPQTAPFNPAPLGTYIQTTADKRVVITQNGYMTTQEINGRRDTSIALLTEGLGGGQVFPPGVPAQFWPLEVGKQVTFNYGAGSPLTVQARVLRTETVTVPAGTFFTYVIERTSRPTSGGFGEATDTFWYAPSVGTVVKAASYVPLGSGGVRPYEATQIVLPRPLTGIPVTIPGDTPDKRAAFCAQRGTTLSLANGQSIPVPCITYVQTHLAAYGSWINGGESASVPVTR